MKRNRILDLSQIRIGFNIALGFFLFVLQGQFFWWAGMRTIRLFTDDSYPRWLNPFNSFGALITWAIGLGVVLLLVTLPVGLWLSFTRASDYGKPKPRDTPQQW